MPLPFKHVLFSLGETAQRTEIDVTEENYLDVLTALCSDKPACCARYLVLFAINIATPIKNPALYGPWIWIQDWLTGHAVKNFGTRWDVEHSDFKSNLYSMLNFYVDRIERIDTMFSREFDLPLFFDFIGDRYVRSDTPSN